MSIDAGPRGLDIWHQGGDGWGRVIVIDTEAVDLDCEDFALDHLEAGEADCLSLQVKFG